MHPHSPVSHACTFCRLAPRVRTEYLPLSARPQGMPAAHPSRERCHQGVRVPPFRVLQAQYSAAAKGIRHTAAALDAHWDRLGPPLCALAQGELAARAGARWISLLERLRSTTWTPWCGADQGLLMTLGLCTSWAMPLLMVVCSGAARLRIGHGRMFGMLG